MIVRGLYDISFIEFEMTDVSDKIDMIVIKI
jgi:hypothetical protein